MAIRRQDGKTGPVGKNRKGKDAKTMNRIISDTREQKAYRFPGATRTALETGDYSIEGLENKVAVERKTRNDLLSCIGTERDRFTRELERLSKFDLAVIMIECNFRDMLNLPNWSELHKSQVFGSILSWIPKYGVVFFFAGSRKMGERATKKILEKYKKYEKK